MVDEPRSADPSVSRKKPVTEPQTPAPTPADPGTANPQTGGTPSDQSTTTQPQEPQSQPQGVFVPQDEYNTMRTNAERFKGDRPLVEAALSAGVRSPDDFQKFVAAQQTLERFQQAGHDPNSILQMLGGKAPQQTQQTQTPTSLGEDQIRSIIGGELASHEAKSAHEQQWTSMNDSLISEVDKIAGENASDARRRVIEDVVARHANAQIERYPDGHPLAGKAKPLTSAQIQSAIASATSEISEFSGAQIRQNATQPNVPNQGGGLQSNTGGNGIAGQDERPVWARTKQEQIAHAEQFLTQRAQNRADGIALAGTQPTA